MWFVKKTSDNSTMRGDCDHLKRIHKLLEHEMKELQTTAILGTANIMAGSADVKVQNTLHGPNNITCSSDRQYRTAATLYIP